MLDKMIYINHIGTEQMSNLDDDMTLEEKLEILTDDKYIIFGKDGLYVNYSNVRDYAWAYDSTNDQISNFKKGVVSKQLPFVIKASTDGDGIRNHICDVADIDVQMNSKGTLYIGNYYTRCYIYSISNTDYLIDNNYKKGTIGICTDEPYWHCEDRITATPSRHAIYNNFSTPSDFIMKLYGEAGTSKGSISITIGGHVYMVNTTLESDEELWINSLDKTVIKISSDGTRTNEFNKRNKSSSIFEKIPSGFNLLNRNGVGTFDLILIDNRSEPKWGD